MDQKNINKLTLPNGVTDSETGAQPRTENGGPASSDSVKSSPSSPFHESFARRRASSVSLPKLKIPSADNLQAAAAGDADAAAGNAAAAAAAAAEPNRPELIEAAEEGFDHFAGFLKDEIERNGLQPPADLEEDIQR